MVIGVQLARVAGHRRHINALPYAPRLTYCVMIVTCTVAGRAGRLPMLCGMFAVRFVAVELVLFGALAYY